MRASMTLTLLQLRFVAAPIEFNDPIATKVHALHII